MAIEFSGLPDKVDWSRLITMLRESYERGDGGLPADSGISATVISEGVVHGVYSLNNGNKLWKLGIARLSIDDVNSCIID